VSPEGTLSFRAARREDLPAIVAMLADDALGAVRERVETPLPRSYDDAFEAIERNPDNELVVACAGDRVVGALQLTFIPGLSHQGAWRCLIESVRVVADARGRGIGQAMMAWVMAHARERGARIVQLTTHNSRDNAQRFYRRLGFEASHVGMKRTLD